MTLAYYRPSGRIPRSGIVAIAAAGLVAIFSAQAYAWLMVNLLSLGSDLRLLCSLFAGLGIATLLSVLARWAAGHGKVRNPAWMGRAGAAIGVLAWYVQWSAYVVIDGVRMSGDALGFSVIEFVARLCLRPEALFAWAFQIPLINASIALQCGLFFCWFLEFCVHLFPPMLAGRKRASLPFCETGAQWAQEIEVETDFEPLAQPDAARRQLESDPGRFACMLVPRVEDPVGNHTRVTLYRCPGPESFITIRSYQEMPLEAAPLPSEVCNVMGDVSGNAECFCEEPVVELLRVPVPDLDALLRQWSAALGDSSSGARELHPAATLSKP